jgi:hypothetical protein
MTRSFVAALAAILCAAPATAQTAEFKCPAEGTVVEFSDGFQSIWEKTEANFCSGRFVSGTSTGVFNWYAPALGLEAAGPRLARTQGLVAQFKPAQIWPLSVGKKIVGRYEGVSGSGDPPRGVWEHTVTIDKYEKITTKAGTFDVFVVTHVDLAISHNYRYTERAWYAPGPGLTVRSAVSTSTGGGERSREAVSIRR